MASHSLSSLHMPTGPSALLGNNLLGNSNSLASNLNGNLGASTGLLSNTAAATLMGHQMLQTLQQLSNPLHLQQASLLQQPTLQHIPQPQQQVPRQVPVMRTAHSHPTSPQSASLQGDLPLPPMQAFPQSHHQQQQQKQPLLGQQTLTGPAAGRIHQSSAYAVGKQNPQPAQVPGTSQSRVIQHAQSWEGYHQSETGYTSTAAMEHDVGVGKQRSRQELQDQVKALTAQIRVMKKKASRVKDEEFETYKNSVELHVNKVLLDKDEEMRRALAENKEQLKRDLDEAMHLERLQMSTDLHRRLREER